MGVSFILTVHITLLGIISVGCRRSFLPFNNMTPQITKDEKMIKCGILHLLMVNILWLAHNNNNNIFALLNVTLSQVQSMDVKTKYS